LEHRLTVRFVSAALKIVMDRSDDPLAVGLKNK